MNVLYVCADTTGERNSVVWRCEIPNRAINATPGNAAKNIWIADWVQGKADDDCRWADAIIVQRNLISGALLTACKWLAHGKHVFVDLDDAYEFIPQSVISASFWKNKIHTQDGKSQMLDFDPVDHLRWGMKLLTGVTSPSPMIVQDRSALTDHAYLVPNYPEVDPYLKAAQAKQWDGKIRIGWAGGGSHIDSFFESGVMPALARVAEARPNVEILILGPHEVYQKLGTKKKTWQPWVQFEEYHPVLAKLDVAVAPLVGPYDRRRSWIKAIEYSLMCIPWVGSDYGLEPQPYSHWKHRLVRNQAKHWENALLDIVDNFETRKVEMEPERQWAIEQDVHKHVDDILEVYGRN